MAGFGINRFWLVLTLTAVSLGGCSASGPDSFAFGKSVEPKPLQGNPFPTNYKIEIATYIRLSTSNPTKIKDAFIAEPVLKTVDKSQFYISCVRYNPRDYENKYEGNQTKLAIFLGGGLNQFLPERPELCSGLNYVRYPEIESLVP